MIHNALLFFVPASPPVITAAGTIVGSGEAGTVHTVSGFSFTGSGTVTYSWRVDDVEVAVTASYTPTVGQIGGELKRRTTVTNGAGSVFAETDFVVITAFQPYMKFNVNKNSQYVSLLEDV